MQVRKCLPDYYIVLPFVRPPQHCHIQYTYSCINVHCCSSSILCCRIGPYNGSSYFVLPKPACWLLALNSPTWLAINISSPKLRGTPPSSRTPAAQTSMLAPYPSTSDTITNSSRSVPEKPHQLRKHTFPKRRFGKTVIVDVLFSHHGMISGLGYITMRNVRSF